jgi:hypothetical protein
MRVPIILLSGQAGSGKDTVAGFLVKNHGAVAIAQADPMKRLAAKLFGFSEETLWGPSARRNERASGTYLSSRTTLLGYAPTWVDEVLPGLSTQGRVGAVEALLHWYDLHIGGGHNGDAVSLAPTARHVLQTLGTEWGRAFSRDMWVDLALRTARELLCGGFRYDRTLGLVEVPFAVSGDQTRRYSVDLVVVTDGRFRNELLAVRAAGGATVKIVSQGAGLHGTAASHASETEQTSIPESWFDVVLTNDKAHGLAQLERAVGFLEARVLHSPSRRVETWEEHPSLIPMWQGES